jgi:hypothetical protein
MGRRDGLLAAHAAKAAREQPTLIRIFEELCGHGYEAVTMPCGVTPDGGARTIDGCGLRPADIFAVTDGRVAAEHLTQMGLHRPRRARLLAARDYKNSSRNASDAQPRTIDQPIMAIAIAQRYAYLKSRSLALDGLLMDPRCRYVQVASK